MKKILIGVIVLIVACALCLSASATFVGEGLVGYLLIHLAVFVGAVYVLPKLFAPRRSKIGYSIEAVLGVLGGTAFIVFGFATGMGNAVLQRIGAWMLLSSLVLFGIGVWYSAKPRFLPSRK